MFAGRLLLPRTNVRVVGGGGGVRGKEGLFVGRLLLP